jgi:plastocyanin
MKMMTMFHPFEMTPLRILRSIAVLAPVLTIAFVAAGCHGKSYNPTGPVATATPRPGATPTPPPVTVVSIQDFSFTPAMVTVRVGDTVQWNWAGGTHSTTSGACPSCNPDGHWDSGVKSTGSTFSHTFTSSDLGTRPYYCTVHLTLMTGTVQVNP